MLESVSQIYFVPVPAKHTEGETEALAILEAIQSSSVLQQPPRVVQQN